MRQDMNKFRIQSASVEFLALNGISDHLDIGIQSTFTPGVSITGYFAILGYDARLGGGLRLGIEKASADGKNNWLHSGKSITLDAKKVYRIQIRTDQYPNKICAIAKLFRYESSKWSLLATTNYDDFFGDSDGDPLKGGVVWFGAVNQSNPIYFDHFRVEWY